MKKTILAVVLTALNVASLFAQTSSSPSNPTPALQLTNATVNEMIHLYAEATTRNALRYPRLPEVVFNLTIWTTNRAEIANTLEKAFAEKDISLIPDGEKFVMVLPTKLKAMAEPDSTNILALTEKYNSLAGTNSTGTIQKGDVNLANVTMEQILTFYGGLVGRHFKDTHEDFDTPGGINFTTVSPITRIELFYALDTLLKWQGIKMVPDGAELKAVKISDK